jgi:hypothetical protein
LVVGCCAFQIDEPGDEELPCLWKRLKKIASAKRSASGRKLHINDSKLVYSPSTGLKELERSVLAVAATLYGWSDTLDEFVSHAAGHAVADIAGYNWYQTGTGETFPIEQPAVGVRIMTNALQAEIGRAGTRCVYLAARVVCERQLNKLLAATRNKASALFSTAVIHLDQLIRTFGEQNLTIVCDRQGGREHYGSLLRLMFEDWSLEVTDEKDGFADYRLSRSGHTVRIIFRERAEAGCMPVALASMLSKYLREALMRRFNAYWLGHLPGLAPTAGYYNDGLRFLQDIDAKRRELGITDDVLIRAR